MYELKSLKLTNFRNQLKREIGFGQLSLIVGQNGIGKTNLIEALYLFSTTKSFRTNNSRNLILFNCDFARIEMKLTKDGRDHQIALTLVKNGRHIIKTFKIDHQKTKSLAILGYFPSVLFSPETLNLIQGSPAERRRFLDYLISQVNRRYANNLIQYLQVVRSRNLVLVKINQGRANLDELVFWDQQLIDLGVKIILERIKLIDFINQQLADIYATLSQDQSKLQLVYQPSFVFQNAQKLKSDFEQKLALKRHSELLFQKSLLGPHRDNFEFHLGGKNLASFGSRGELRSAILALKLRETAYLEEKIQEKPLILLDDVFSELDLNRRHQLVDLISTYQTVITATDVDQLSPELLKKAKVINL